MLKSVLLCFLCIFSFAAIGQTTVWSEDFSSYSNGVTTGDNNNTANAAVDWTSGGCTTCPSSSSDYWEIRSNLMEARDVNGEIVFWESEVIDISGEPSISFSMVISETGDHEGLYSGVDDCVDATSQDHADVFYSIDGGAYTLIPNSEGWCGLYASCATHTLYGDNGPGDGDCRAVDVDWESATVTQPGLSGSTLQLRFEATNSAGTERIRLSDVSVSSTVPLPVTFLVFDAAQKEQAVQLNWSTGSEQNNSHFLIERSADGRFYETIGSVTGQGESTSRFDYSFSDELPLKGTSYYRLKQIDFNGEYAYSSVQSVNYTAPFGNLQLYPQPAKDVVTLTFDNDGTPWNALVVDSKGRTVQSYNNVTASSLEVRRGALPSGLYFVILTDANGEQHTAKALFH